MSQASWPQQAFVLGTDIFDALSMKEVEATYADMEELGLAKPPFEHYGPNHELVKQIFIQPVFVNADKGWIAERTAYNVSGVKP